MTVISIRTFNGEIPRLPADRLPDGAAQVAQNCDLTAVELRPLQGLGTHYTAGVSPVRGLFTDDGLRFYCWDKPTRAYLHPTIDDAYGRVIYHEHGVGLKVALASGMTAMNLSPAKPATSWDVGVSGPTAAPTVSLGATTGKDNEDVSIVAVAVNIWGEESAPSPPLRVTKQIGQPMTISVAHTATSGQQSLAGIAFYRTYANTADYFLINVTPVALSGGSASLVDASTAPNTATALASAEWGLPPAAPNNLTYAGNGFFVVGSGRDLVFSEPYHPHAWPYRMTLPNAIVGVTMAEGGILVTTQGPTFLVSGAHPSQMSQTFLPVEQAGWSDTAVARMGGAAVYASNDGLVRVAGGQPSITESQTLFRRKDWRARYAASRLNLRLAHHDGQLLGLVDPSYPIGASGTPFLIRLDEADGMLCRLDVGQSLYGAAVSSTTDQLFALTSTGFAEFAAGSSLAYEWWSGEKLYPLPVNFAAGVVDAVGTATMTIYADGTLRHTTSISGRTTLRMPAGAPAYRWSVRLVGTATVREVSLGASFAELKGA
jgi:hypothetical protein